MKNSEQAMQFSGYSILFVDDEELARHYFTRICSSNFKVITADNANQALDILQNDHDKIAILVTDQRMPGLSGTELLKKVQNLYPDIIRLLTTAYMERDESVDQVIQGEILEKPWNIEKLRNALSIAMQSRIDAK